MNDFACMAALVGSWGAFTAPAGGHRSYETCLVLTQLCDDMVGGDAGLLPLRRIGLWDKVFLLRNRES